MVRIADDDIDTITASMDGTEIRAWGYADRSEQRTKMGLAREFAEGWFQCAKHKETAQ